MMARPSTLLMATKSADSQKSRIWRNVIGLVGGVGIFTMGLNPMDDLQSSLNDRDGLGIGSLSIKYAFMILGNLFTNTLIIRKLGSKRALVWGTLLYCLYIVANFYPSWSTMVPLTVLSGLGGALMWTTQSHYLATLAENLARLRLEGVAAAEATASGQVQAPASTASAISDNVKTMIFGFRGVAIRLFAIVGGIASSLILSTGWRAKDGDVQEIVVTMGVCKAEFCTTCEDVIGLGCLDALGADVSRFGPNRTHQQHLQSASSARTDNVSSDNAQQTSSKLVLCATRSPVSMTAVYVLCAFCTASAILGVLLLMLCVDQLPKKAKTNEAEEEEQDQLDSPCTLVLATVRLWKRKEQLFMIPITIACGFQEAFWRADFNKTPIMCALEIEQIPFILVCYYTAMLIGSSICGSWLGNRRARTIALPVMAIVDMVSLSAMFLWKFELVAGIRSTTIAYVATAITGTMYGAITSLLPAFYGILFPNDSEAAYSNLFFWCFLGSTLMYALSRSLCLVIKLAVVLVTITIGLVGYLATEFTSRSCNRN